MSLQKSIREEVEEMRKRIIDISNDFFALSNRVSDWNKNAKENSSTLYFPIGRPKKKYAVKVEEEVKPGQNFSRSILKMRFFDAESLKDEALGQWIKSWNESLSGATTLHFVIDGDVYTNCSVCKVSTDDFGFVLEVAFDQVQ